VIVSAPGISKAGSRTKSLIETVDIYPTLAELAGLPASATLDGRSFAAVLKDASASTRDHAIHVYPRSEGLGRAIRTDRYRLVEWKPIGTNTDKAVFELYDYQADPLESKNLASDQPAIVTELRALLAKHPEAKPQIQNKPAVKKSEPSKDRGAMFDSRDKDKDGKLTKEEFLANQPDEAPKRFPRFDSDSNGSLSREEFIKGGKK
jgi:iduronate 2-sulfatase